MTQKITLSIPDRLHEKLSEWRTSFNLSKMFQDALTDAIQKKEALEKKFHEEFDMSEIVQRLQQEKNEWLKNFYKEGRTTGVGWARAAHYTDLLYVLDYGNACDAETGIVQHSRFKSYFERIYDAHDLTRYARQGFGDHEKQFLEGWFDGVNAFWNEVKEHL